MSPTFPTSAYSGNPMAHYYDTEKGDLTIQFYGNPPETLTVYDPEDSDTDDPILDLEDEDITNQPHTVPYPLGNQLHVETYQNWHQSGNFSLSIPETGDLDVVLPSDEEYESASNLS